MDYAGPAEETVGYVEQQGEFCPRANVHLATTMVPFDGTLQSLVGHQCYTKCSLQAPCEGDDCHCEGHYSGYDSLESNALCASRPLCEYICDQLDGKDGRQMCASFDMHATLPRCFLNLATECAGNRNHVYELVGTDPNYNLWMKSLDP